MKIKCPLCNTELNGMNYKEILMTHLAFHTPREVREAFVNERFKQELKSLLSDGMEEHRDLLGCNCGKEE